MMVTKLSDLTCSFGLSEATKRPQLTEYAGVLATPAEVVVTVTVCSGWRPGDRA